MLRGLSDDGFASVDTGDLDVLGFDCARVERFADRLSEILTPSERLATRALLFQGIWPTLKDFSKVHSVTEILAAHSSRWIGEMLEARRYKSLMQPIVTPTGEVHGYEFLFRGLHPDGSLVPPMQIFDAAADLDLSRRIDEAAGSSALDAACRHQLAVKLFVNVMPATVLIEDAAFIRTWADAAERTIDPKSVVFEIVESQSVDDVRQLEQLAKRLRSHGFQIALDDFGAGFNNLTLIPHVQPDYIKLDKALVQRIDTDARMWTLVANMIDAAKQNGILVIAEGVETRKVAQMLETMGCDLLQGYHYGAPAEGPLVRKA
ncbi:MAG: EAL domain-containing protein [Rhodothalassiaceae bacterium]